MPQKPAKFGIMFGTVCDITACFVLRGFPCVDKEEKEVGLGKHVTLSLVEPYENTGLKLTTNNFFTSLSLARRLW